MHIIIPLILRANIMIVFWISKLSIDQIIFLRYQALNLGKYNTYGNIRGFVQYMSLVQWHVYRISSMNNCTLLWTKIDRITTFGFRFQVNRKAQNHISVYLQGCGLEPYLMRFCLYFLFILIFLGVLRWWIGVLSGHSLDRIVH